MVILSVEEQKLMAGFTICLRHCLFCIRVEISASVCHSLDSVLLLPRCRETKHIEALLRAGGHEAPIKTIGVPVLK